MSHPTEHIRFCTSRDGTRIAYATCGSGPPLVWVPHWVHHLKFAWDSPVWRPWLSLLTRHHTLIRYDWRGCGLSDRESIAFSGEKYVEDLEAVVGAADLDQFLLFGISNGAMCCAAFAARHPTLVTHLVLCGGGAHGRLGSNATPAQVQELQARMTVIELGWPDETPAYRRFFTSLHIPDSSAEQSLSFYELVRRTTSPVNAVGLIRAFAEMDVRQLVPKVRCPTLVLHARGDSIIPFEQGRMVAALIPRARFVPLESGNHIILDTEQAWQHLVNAIDDFFPKSITSPAALAIGELTAREREVLEVVAQGLDNVGIAARLKISDKTVRNHVSIIFAKLGVTSRAQAVALARDAGLGRPVR